MAEHWPGLVFTVPLEGQEIVGGWLSTTVTVNEQMAACPLAAFTLKVFVVVPTGKLAPEGKPTVCEVEAPGQLSVPTGVI